jgi:predicted AlkP superfamily pyrophosphatase or phosphodiesterase
MKVHQFVAALLLLCGPCQAVDSPPKLVVAVLVDQLRYDYLERFQHQFGKGGFRLLMEEGAFLTFAHYNYAPTVTGPGHASFLSGAPPSVHGIIGNDWFDKRTGKNLNCVSDPDVSGVGTQGNSAKRSPRNFVGSNLADEMRLRFHSKVVGISLKDRGAILPAGKKPAGAFWFDSTTGSFVTSTYYHTDLPKWVVAFNARKLPATFIGQTWTRLLPEGAYQWPDELPGEGALPGDRSKSFDHTIRFSSNEGFETIVPTPFGNQLLAEFAEAAIDGERLGSGSQPDLLCISFSSPDAAGHIFGPYSQEVQDIVLRLDQQLASLFSTLDRKIGLSNVLIALSADHGVAPVPEFAKAEGLDGERADTTQLLGGLFAALESSFGEGRFFLSRQIHDGNLYFDHPSLRERGIAPEVLAAFIRDWALSTGQYQAAFTRSQLLEGRVPAGLGQMVLNGFHAERSGDVVLVKKPFQLYGNGSVGTTHGSPYSYDTHIPVLFFGRAFKPGRYADKFSITDIAPTLSAALRMTPPSGNVGAPLTAILSGH